VTQSRFADAQVNAAFRVEIIGDPLPTPDDALVDLLSAAVEDAIRDNLSGDPDIRLSGSIFITTRVELEPE
jgi:hypothetical protein